MAVDRLNAEDRLMLWSDESWPQDIGALAVLDGDALLEPDGRFRIEVALEAIERRLHLVPRFRQLLYQPAPGLGRPLWLDDPGFTVRNHVRVTPLPVPGDEAQLLIAIERLRARRLDRTRPLWEICFLPGVSDARVGMFIRWHHVIADGVAGVAGIGAMLDSTVNFAAPPRPWAAAPPPSYRQLLSDNIEQRASELGRAVKVLTHPAPALRHARAGWPAVRELLTNDPGPRTSLNRLVGPHRTLALIRADLDQVIHVAHAHRATVNDVLLAMTAGGLQRLLSGRGEPVDDLTLPIYVPVSLRRDRSHPGTGNLISQMVVPLPLGTTDTRQRLRRIAAETFARKANARPSLGTVFRSRIAARVMLPLIAKQRVNVETADLPGPPEVRYFAGSRVLEVFPLLNLIGNVSLGVGALSYSGQLNIMAVGDADTYPDIDVFIAGARDELSALINAGNPAAR